VSQSGELGFLRAKVLGGTSIVNQALLDPFDDLAWDDWRKRSGIDWFTRERMARHYDECLKTVKLSPIPVEHYNRNTKTFIRGLEKQGYGWKPLQRAQGDCALEKGSDCIVCLGGCPRESKQSSLVTVIREARKLGLVVESEVEVDSVNHDRDEVRITIKRARQSGASEQIRAARVVLAGGSLGNTMMLLKSGYARRLPALGSAFSCHPQYMSYGLFDDIVDSHKGAFQAVKSDEPRFRAQGFKLENVYGPPIGTAMLVPGYGRDHMKWMKRYRSMASMEVATRDEPAGRITLQGDKLKIDKRPTERDQETIRRGIQTVREILMAAGAREVLSCTQGFGLHLMGGCPMGTDPARSVVDPEFRVHGMPRLIAADSSVFPSAPGINPSFTIMAMSQRAAEGLLKGRSG
jgi:choline dehydrogenase-like flavoprotein